MIMQGNLRDVPPPHNYGKYPLHRRQLVNRRHQPRTEETPQRRIKRDTQPGREETHPLSNNNKEKKKKKPQNDDGQKTNTSQTFPPSRF